MVTAVHESLSQQGLESTGDFTFSSKILQRDAMTQAREQYAKLSESFFGTIDPSEFYSCDADLFRIEKGQKVKVWRSPIPLRTYFCSRRLAPGSRSGDGDHRQLRRNPSRYIERQKNGF